ncbi:MAG: tRNA (adenosine(37)-N6)-threonylcarbamoyltransferase complex transferase subunit TsaD [Bacteroidales bacterium]|nr:tRNA (adenosine(37)-N6)-threonylcarbamoyltransferase complex transferase subunit TsaD [Bacteroidales bacterium]
MSITILGIESSCDDTSAAVIQDGYLLSNIIADQDVHRNYGGVVPELASRAHQQNIIPVVEQAIKSAGISRYEIDAVAFTRGPGLLGSLLVGTSFAKGFAMSLDIPIIEVNHLQAHVLAQFIRERGKSSGIPAFPFLSLLVSGGHTQLMIVRDYLDMETIGRTIDDAAGEAFDKCGKVIGLPYPAGPEIDKLSVQGDRDSFQFNKPRIKDLDFSFSGLKTSFLYFVRDKVKDDKEFVQKRKPDLCASLQKTIIDILLNKLIKASEKTGISNIGVAGGVSANSALRNTLTNEAQKRDWDIYFPELNFATDNAAMIAITGYFKFKKGLFSSLDIAPLARMDI